MGYDPWILYQEGSDSAALARTESLFSLGNGYLGFRGFYPERHPAFHAGVFVNGFYEIETIEYGERAYGFAQYNQVMLDLPDARFLQITVDGEPLRCDRGTVHAHERILHMREGTVTRTLDWEGENGSRVRVRWETLISYQRRETGALQLSIEPVSCSEIQVISSIAQPALRHVDHNDPRVRVSGRASVCRGDRDLEPDSAEYPIAARFAAEKSGLLLLCGCVHTHMSGAHSVEYAAAGQAPASVICTGGGTQPLSLTKVFVYHSGEVLHSRRMEERFTALLADASELTFDTLKGEQIEVLSQMWRDSHVEIPSDFHLEQAIRFNLFQLFQSAGKDGETSLAAKGLTGSGYEGHYFWDTEIYGLPFFTYTQPEIARALLAYRISLIPKARRRAAELSQKGILFPWRTINGDEASAYFPAGTAQYHINADIAYSLLLYLQITGDSSIMAEGGAQLLFETARFWYDIGFFSDRRDGAFCIHEVTGPDEYTALVNNNLYTNLMAQINLQGAVSFYEEVQRRDPQLAGELTAAAEISEQEVAGWREAAQRMYLPFDTRMGIHPQDDAFLDRRRWNFADTPKDHYPLLLHYHPLVIYRHQVIKQADVVLAHILRPEVFPWYEKVRDYSYYEELTTGDSSLSACMQGIMAVEVGDLEKGLMYLRKTALMDIDDYQGNVRDGLHTAAMAGSWLSLVYGFAGLRWIDDRIHLAPVIHDRLPEYTFRLRLRGSLIEVHVTGDLTDYTLLDGVESELVHHGKLLQLTRTSEQVSVPTDPPFSAVIFDLDGVITSTDRQHYQAWKHLADELDLDFSEEINQQLRGVSRRESLEIIGRHNGRIFSEEEIRQHTETKNGYYRALLQELTSDALLPGFTQLCLELRRHGIQIGVASASRNAPFILERLEVTDMIDKVVPAGELTAGKPDPEVFVRCADLLGVPRRACVGFEDARVGVEAIQRAGMYCVAVGESAADMSSDLHITDLSEVSFASLSGLWDGSQTDSVS